MERSPELYIGLLAVLKSGAAYLPLDPESPPRRLSLMLQDTKAATLLVHPPSLARIAALDPSMPWLSVENRGNGHHSVMVAYVPRNMRSTNTGLLGGRGLWHATGDSSGSLHG